MKRLSYETLEQAEYTGYILRDAPERILQFGEGNFLRGFVDYFFDILNEKQLFCRKCVVVQPLAEGKGELLNEQQGLYSLYLRGEQDGQTVTEGRVISVISRVINPYLESGAFFDCAHNPDLRIIVSNTTEAGIVFCSDDQPGDMHGTFPAKLTSFLWERYQQFGGQAGKGMIVLSCELIENNGAELKNCVLRYAKLWSLPEAFSAWIETENVFCNTLVDRIITGYPAREAEQINQAQGYEDRVMDTGEPFAFWAIEGPAWLRQELPFEQAGLPVKIVADQTGYKKRKVRILNGAQTGTTLAAFLAGMELEREYMNDARFSSYIRNMMFEEIIPATDLDEQDMKQFAQTCLERLINPFIDHRLLDITLNSVSKWRARVLPTLCDYYQKFHAVPRYLAFSLAALLAFYRCTERDGRFYGQRGDTEYEIRDDREALRFFAAHSGQSNPAYVHAYMQQTALHGMDFTTLPGVEQAVVQDLDAIDRIGICAAVDSLMA